ncbi:hypothetical protein LguiB_022614 [Lonicera macranthoides]
MILDMIAAAIDTSYAGIDWILTELIWNPRVMKHLQEELKTVTRVCKTVEERRDTSIWLENVEEFFPDRFIESNICRLAWTGFSASAIWVRSKSVSWNAFTLNSYSTSGGTIDNTTVERELESYGLSANIEPELWKAYVLDQLGDCLCTSDFVAQLPDLFQRTLEFSGQLLRYSKYRQHGRLPPTLPAPQNLLQLH